jgi:hypothetical protein
MPTFTLITVLPARGGLDGVAARTPWGTVPKNAPARNALEDRGHVDGRVVLFGEQMVPNYAQEHRIVST